MITISTDLNAATAPLLQSARPQLAPSLSPVALAQTTPRPPEVDASPDPLTTLLQAAVDPPEQTLPQTDLARRYAESGTLTAATRPATAAATATQRAGDDRLLQALREAYRGGAQGPPTQQGPTPPTPSPPPIAMPQPPAVVIDGRTIPLTPAQAAAIRAAIGATPRRIGRGAQSGEIEAPRGPSDAVEGPARPLIKSVTEAGSPDMRHAGEFAPAHDEASRSVTANHGNADMEKARTFTSEEAWIPPLLPLLEGTTPTTLLAPVPHPVAYVPPQTVQAMAEITIAFAAGIASADVVAMRNDRGGVTIAIPGPERIEFPARVPVTLAFADGNVRRIDPTP